METGTTAEAFPSQTDNAAQPRSSNVINQSICSKNINSTNAIIPSETQVSNQFKFSPNVLSPIERLFEEVFLLRSHMRSMAETMQTIQQKVDMILKDHDYFINHRDEVRQELRTINEAILNMSSINEESCQRAKDNDHTNKLTEFAITPSSLANQSHIGHEDDESDDENDYERADLSPGLDTQDNGLTNMKTEIAIPPQNLASQSQKTNKNSILGFNEDKKQPRSSEKQARKSEIINSTVSSEISDSESSYTCPPNQNSKKSKSWASISADLPTPSSWATVSTNLPKTFQHQAWPTISCNMLAFSGNLPSLSQPQIVIKNQLKEIINNHTGLNLSSDCLKSIQINTQSFQPKIILEFKNLITSSDVWNSRQALHKANIFPEQWLTPKKQMEQQQVLQYFLSQRKIVSHDKYNFNFNAFSQGNSIKIVDLNSNKYFFSPDSKIKPKEFLNSIGLT